MQCSPRASAGAPLDSRAAKLASVTVEEASEVALNLEATGTPVAGQPATLSARLDPAAEGTVEFTSGSLEASAPVVDGVATAELPTGPNPGQQEITAEFTPAPRSAFATGTASAPITIDAVTGTTIELNADQIGPVRPGQPVSISATVTPAENTERAEGTVEFLIDGERITRTLEDHATSVEFTPNREGNFPVEAKFIPADDTQTPAEDVLTVQVKGATETQLEVNAPQSVEPLVEAPTTVTVTPAAAGTVTAVIVGRRISAEVQEGTATVPLVFPREGEFEVPITFVPANPADAKRKTTTTTITVAAPAASDVAIALDGPDAAKKGQSTSYTATLTPEVGSQRSVTGFLEILIDGKPVTKNGQTARIPVVEGIAEFDVLWNRAGAQELTAVFHNASGEEVSRTATTVTVAGDTGTPGDGNNQNPGDGANNQVTPGGSNSSATNPFAPLIDFFQMLWEWLTSLFSGGRLLLRQL